MLHVKTFTQMEFKSSNGAEIISNDNKIIYINKNTKKNGTRFMGE